MDPLTTLPVTPTKPNPWALLPLWVFLLAYLVVSILAGDFYKMPISVAFVIAAIVAVANSKGQNLTQKIELFCKGAADGNIMLMVLIFILAGAFAQTTKAMGAVDSMVHLTLWLLPQKLLVPGLFLAACFISVSVGTSVGTIVALIPVAAGIAVNTGIEPALMAAAVVSGAMFGDNLSFISDTTIVATRTQGCRMKDKFRTNLRIVLPFAILTAILYFFIGQNNGTPYAPGQVNWLHVLPYLAVLGAAVAGVHVMLVLIGGTIFAGIIGILTHGFNLWGWTGAMGTGITGMGELIVVTILAGGMLEMIRVNGGFDWIIQKMTKHTHSVRAAEFSIAGLVSFANLCTANNTIALIMSGPIAKEIATRFKIPANRTASLMDIFSCFVQGAIPYGAQLLMAAGLAKLSPIAIMQYLYYPYLLGVGAIVAIWFGYPKKGPRKNEKKKESHS
ncbi:MAG: Na+/H+ antiporter NhaC family protein [Elusimicrobiaceae bacterium]|nr:Na+/H+ antiporter NhaC family protein [Elusimicrobiaceae bacterium]